MARNAYANKLNARKLSRDASLITETIQTEYALMFIMLNRTFGFGPKRLERARAAMDVLNEEYADAINLVDVTYGKERLDRTVQEILSGKKETK